MEDNTGICDKNGVLIKNGDKLKLNYKDIEIIGEAKFNDTWEIYKDSNNHLDLKHLRKYIVIIN